MQQNTVRQRLGPLTLERFARICILCGKIQCDSVLSHWGPRSLSFKMLVSVFYTAKYSAAAPVALGPPRTLERFAHFCILYGKIQCGSACGGATLDCFGLLFGLRVASVAFCTAGHGATAPAALPTPRILEDYGPLLGLGLILHVKTRCNRALVPSKPHPLSSLLPSLGPRGGPGPEAPAYVSFCPTKYSAAAPVALGPPLTLDSFGLS